MLRPIKQLHAQAINDKSLIVQMLMNHKFTRKSVSWFKVEFSVNNFATVLLSSVSSYRLFK